MSDETRLSQADDGGPSSLGTLAHDTVSPSNTPARAEPAHALFDFTPTTAPDELSFEARQKITLRCGKSSITLHPNGKIVLKGEYIVSDAEGINRIVGGHIELN